MRVFFFTIFLSISDLSKQVVVVSLRSVFLIVAIMYRSMLLPHWKKKKNYQYHFKM